MTHSPLLRQNHNFRNFVFNMCLICCSIFCGLLIAEMYFRLLDPQSIIPRYVETSPYGIRKNIGHVRGNMIVPEYQHAFSTNSQGFRGTKEYSITKPPGVYRIIVLGDSVTLGHGVEDGETFSAILEEQLSLDRPTEVINMGVSGFGTAEELIQLRNVGFVYQPDLIILAYFTNDPYNNVVSELFSVTDGHLSQKQQTFVPAIYVRDRLYLIPGYSFLCQHSHLVNFLRNHASGFFIKRLAQKNNISSQTSPLLSAQESELTGLLLNKVISEAQQHKLPLVILNIPVIRNDAVISNFPKDRVNIDPSFVHLVDVNKAVYSAHDLDKLSYEKDSHPKPFAHQQIGLWLGDFIRQKIWSSS
ncbi:MAG: hypothetical protein R3B95_17570 [Nitrospirales bacterium]|nr:hypothetical protein [Nitrospirales bacterium]